MYNRWSMKEEYLLANVWLEVHDSRDLVNEHSFWNEVTQRFNDQTDGEHHKKIVLRLNGIESTLNVVDIMIFTKSCSVQVKTLVISAMQTEFIMNAMGEGYIINMCGSF